MQILVIRHGQTDWNVERRVQGITDIPLNQKGIEQAHKAKGDLKVEKIDLIISSPLKRARQTAEIINSERKSPIQFDERLKEISYGKMEGKFSNEFKNRTEFGNIVEGKLYTGAEASKNFLDRVFTFLEELKKYREDSILLVTHKEVCRAIDFYFNRNLKKEKRKRKRTG